MRPAFSATLVGKSGADLPPAQLRVESRYGNVQLCGSLPCGRASLPQSLYLLPFIEKAKSVTSHAFFTSQA